MIKSPGMVWVAALAPGIAIAMLPRQRIRILATLSLIAICTMLAASCSQSRVLPSMSVKRRVVTPGEPSTPNLSSTSIAGLVLYRRGRPLPTWNSPIGLRD